MAKKYKERNSMGQLSQAGLKRAFKERQAKQEKKAPNSEKSQAKREISRLKREKKGKLAHHGNIDYAIGLRKEKHGLK